ncbi:MAG: cytochrome P450 [Rhizobiaceae bacterium]
MTSASQLFVPPAPTPRKTPIGAFELIRTVYRNPLEIWGEPSFNEPWLAVRSLGVDTIIANDPGLIRHVLIDEAANYVMSPIRQRILRPILRDGLLTAEGEVWKRSRKAMAPVFTPRHIFGFADSMLSVTNNFADNYSANQNSMTDVSKDMTNLTYDILAATLFSNQIAGAEDFSKEVEHLFETMGRVDPFDLLGAPDWLPRFTQIRGRKSLAFFRNIVAKTMEKRKELIEKSPNEVPSDFLTLLLKTEGPDGLTRAEIEDNIITFIGAGHETTARALGWTLYLLAKAPGELALVEAEIDGNWSSLGAPSGWLDKLPLTRAAFEEAMRLYPPAPSLNRSPVKDDQYGDLKLPKGANVLVMPWVIHRHRKYWENPDAFDPSRFHPENRDKIDRFQYLPFGQGPRICIGATFALQEAVIVLAVLLKRFRFEPFAGHVPWPVQKLTTQPQGGLPMRITLR